MLEVLFTFFVILFAGFSVTLGVFLGKRPQVQSCHGDSRTDAEVTSSKCQTCGAIGGCHDSNDLGIKGFRN